MVGKAGPGGRQPAWGSRASCRLATEVKKMVSTVKPTQASCSFQAFPLLSNGIACTYKLTNLTNGRQDLSKLGWAAAVQ